MYRVGIVGMGSIGDLLADDLNTTEGAELTAVVDVDEENRNTAHEKYDVPLNAVYQNPDEMYEQRDLDAVIIATPPTFHYRQILDAASHGVHVLCEKPLVTSLDEARDVVDRFSSSEEVLMAGYQRHLDPAYIHARNRWRESELEPRFITGELTQDWTSHFETGSNWRTDPETGGGGHLFSVGTHVLEAVLWMTGLTPRTVSAEMAFHDDTETIDTQSSLSVQFDNGALGSFADSAVVPATREHVHIWDADGSVYLYGKGWGRRDGHQIAPDGSEAALDADDQTQSKVEAFIDAVETASRPPATAEDALRVTALLEAAYESAQNGHRVTVDL